MSNEESNTERESGTISYSLCSQSCTLMPVSSKPGTIKLSASVAGCNCTKATRSEFPKLCQLTCYPKPVTRPILDCNTSSVEICDCGVVGEDMTAPVLTCESEEEGTHEHKYCSTPCCDHNSKGVQPSEQPSSVSCSDCYPQACSSPLPSKIPKPRIEPRLKDHVPKSVEELKASISGLTGLEKKLPPGNLLGCEYIDYRCQISNSLPCSPTDSQVSFASCPPPRHGFSLTIEPKDHRFCTNPNECRHSREFCPPPPSPPPECPPRPIPPVCPGAAPKAVCPPSPQPPCPGAYTAGGAPKPVCPPPSKPVCPPPSKPVCPQPPKPVCPPPPRPVCPPPPRPVCPPPPRPVCPPPPKPVCPPSPQPPCPGAYTAGGAPKPVCPPPSKPVCPQPPKPVCPPPPRPVCPPPPRPVCPPPPRPVCPPSPCPPPPCPPTPPECPEPDCPPSPCPSPPPCPKPRKPPCAGGCEQCFQRQ